MFHEKFANALARGGDVAANPYLTFLGEGVKSIERALRSQPELHGYADDLSTILDTPNFALSHRATNKFAQLLGEAHFSVLCHEKGVAVRRILELKGKKTPDFESLAGMDKVFFEVKTLSVVGGEAGVNDALESSLGAHLELEGQLRKGERIASAASVVQPYGARPYAEGRVMAVVNTLIEKTRQNIKADQFGTPKTFLVLNLSMIPPSKTDSCVLRPSYPDHHLFATVVTGDLWTLAFGQVGMLIQGYAEFEGQPCVEGTLTRVGILADPEFEDVAGILFMIHPWGGSSVLWGLFRSADWQLWNSSEGDTVKLLRALVGEKWNDEGDRNGWRHSGDMRATPLSRLGAAGQV